MKLKILLKLTLSLFFCFTIHSQNKLIIKVMNYNKEPIDDVQVFLDDKKIDVIINVRGYFELDISKDVKQINIYSPVYGLLTTKYSGEPKLIFIFLNPDQIKTEEDKVDIGYGKVNREDLTYNVQKIDVEKNNQGFIYNNIFDLIRGRLPGVTVTANNKIIIRGVNSIRSSSGPLFVVNGTIVYNIDYIRPIEVKDISVLKGAATSIYGSRGANGVILITLKK